MPGGLSSDRPCCSAPLRPGSYRLTVYGRGIVTRVVPVEIAAGGTISLALPIRAGMQVRLVFREEAGAAVSPILAMRFRGQDPDGRIRGEVELSRRFADPFIWYLGLPCGAYRITATAADGAAHASADVLFREDGPGEVEVPMR
ncbi:MAG: hypothetical protein Fur0037_27140 [Planctomycetota bacterium]